MAKRQYEQDFRDAVELLSMLETLMEGLEGRKHSGSSDSRLPWRGMMLSLRQAKSKLLRGMDRGMDRGMERGMDALDKRPLASEVEYQRSSVPATKAQDTYRGEEGVGVETGEGELQRALPSMGSLSALASRIQKAPTSVGRVRDLGDADSVDEKTARIS